jgi:hypothetical protein
MQTLFGQSEIQKLIDLDYTTESHTFSKGVIAAYYNALEYPLEVNEDSIMVKRRKEKVWFCLGSDIFGDKDTAILISNRVNKTDPHIDLKKDILYSKQKTDCTKIKTKEVVYSLEKIFTNPSKQVRRGITLTNRKEIVLREPTMPEIEQLYQEWQEHKMNDPKVYRIAFTPKRYLRSFQLKEKGFNTVHYGYYVDGELYGALVYEIQGDKAFELAFISRYWHPLLKITNDLNECILTNSFYDLYKKGIKRCNVGPTAGIKGLKTFKQKLPSEELTIYSN